MTTNPSPDTGAVAVGSVLGGFRLTHLLGEGGMGMVFRAENVRVPSIVRALKVVRPVLASDAAFRARFLREAQLTEILRHPNILRIENVDDENGVLFMVMELLVGRSASEIVRATPGGLPITEAARIMVGALTGLSHAHRNGVIHRDLKPANLFVTADGEVKLLDFGIAKGEDVERLTSTGSATPGTPEYYAPEFASGVPASPASDIYALGISLFELLTGAPPFKPGGGTTQQAALSVLLQHVTTPMPDVRTRRPELPEALAAVVRRATEKGPGDRFPDADAFAHALDPFAGTLERARVLANAPREASSPRATGTGATAPMSTMKIGKRRSPVALILVLLVLLGGGAAVGALWFTSPGALSISVRPSDATVYVDGIPVAGKPPFTLPRRRGVYAVSARREGHENAVRTVTVSPATTTSVELHLRPIR